MSKYKVIQAKKYKKSIKKLDDKTLQEIESVVERLANNEALVDIGSHSDLGLTS